MQERINRKPTFADNHDTEDADQADAESEPYQASPTGMAAKSTHMRGFVSEYVGAVRAKSSGKKVGSLAEAGQIPVTILQLEEYLAVQRGLRRSCQTLPLTLALWIAYVTSAFFHFGAKSSFQSANFIRSGIEGCFYKSAGPPEREIRLRDIQEWTDIMPWVDQALVPHLKAPGDLQTLLGFVRVRQTRGESTEACAFLDPEMQAFYASGCFPPGGTVGQYGPKREKYELPESAFEPIAGKKNAYEMWLEVPRPHNVISQRIRKLQGEGWLDLSTQDLSIEGLFLNIEAQIYTKFQLRFVLHREGLVEPELIVFPLRGEVYTHWSEAFVDIVFAVLFAALLYSGVSTLLLDGRGNWRGVVSDPYNWIDIFLILVAGSIVVVFYYTVYWLSKFSTQVFALGSMPALSMAEAPANRKVQASVDTRAYTDRLDNLVDWFDWYTMMTAWLRFSGAVFGIVMIGRFFRGFYGQPRMSVLVQTVLYSSNFILHFVLVLFFIFSNFAVAGYILFGEQLEGWKTPMSSLGRLLLVLFQRFDYQEFNSVAPLSAALWFSAFYVLVTILLVRTLTAAIVHNYLEVRSRLGEPGMGLQQQVTQAVRDALWGRTFEASAKSVDYDDLLNVLSADTDTDHLKRLGNFQVDRRLRSRADLHKAERSRPVDEEYLVSVGCDHKMAARLLEQCRAWTNSISETSSPSRRLMILIARQVNYVRAEAEFLRTSLETTFSRSEKLVDRIDLKHAKSVALARRILNAQQLPPGWTVHTDQEGRRYLRQTETGLTSWTLPKHLL